MINNVLTGKNGFQLKRNAVTLDETLQLQSLVFEPVLDADHLLGRRAIVGQLEHAAKQDRHVFEFGAGAGFDLRNDLMRQIGVRAAEVEMKFHFAVSPGAISPDLPIRAHVEFEGPGVARLLVELPIGLRNRRRVHELVRLEILQCLSAAALFDAVADESGIDAGINDQMCDMDIFADRARAPCFARRRAVRISRSQTLRSRYRHARSPWRR